MKPGRDQFVPPDLENNESRHRFRPLQAVMNRLGAKLNDLVATQTVNEPEPEP
jgi:hypothetical protein